MRILLFATFALSLLASPVLLASASVAGEVHIISRDSYGYFVKSQQIYGSKMRGMVGVNYCGRDYFAFPDTVAWTEDETENGRTVGLEFSNGKTWKLICRNPQEQVRYADIRGGRFGRAWKGPAWMAAKRDAKTKSYHGK